jgi:hypothetical protein
MKDQTNYSKFCTKYCRKVESRESRVDSRQSTWVTAWIFGVMCNKLKAPPKRKLVCNTTPWPESDRELYRPSDRNLLAKLMTTFADRGCHVVSATDPYGRILGFLDRSRYFFFQVAPQLYSRGWVGPVPDPLVLRKSRSAGNRTRTSWSVDL